MAILLCMVTFCLGSARAKRAYIKEIKDGTLLDNIEVIFCSSENGRNYFAYAPIPFGDFRVCDYLAYKRALCGQKVVVSDIKKFGINPNAKLKKLSAAARRTVQFLEKTCGLADKPVIVNLDGMKYSKRGMTALNKLLAAVPEAYVFVTDERYKSRFRGEYKTLMFGSQSHFLSHRFYAARRLAKKVGATKISVM